MFTIQDRASIVVVVDAERYECYGPTTNRSKELVSILQLMGGISDTVAPGTYHFNVHQVGLESIVSLTPFEDNS